MLLSPGCYLFGRHPTANLDVWLAGDGTSVTDRTAKFADASISSDSRQADLFAAANEVVSFQVVIDAPEGVSGLSFAASDLTGQIGPHKISIPAAQVRTYRMLPVKVTQYPAWYLRLTGDDARACTYYDALLDTSSRPGGQPFDLGARSVFWVDVSVPGEALAGKYQGKLVIQSRSHRLHEIPLKLDVYDFQLPNARTTPAVGGFDHKMLFRTLIVRNGEGFEPSRMDRSNASVMEGLTAMRQLMVLSHQHRLDLFEKTMRPQLRYDAGGKVVLDWEDYENIVRPYLSGSAFDDRVGCPAWPAPFCEDWPDAEQMGGIGSETYKSAAFEMLTDSKRFFQSLKASDQAFLWPCRDDVTQTGLDRHLQIAKAIRAVDSQTPILSQMPLLPPVQAGLKLDPQMGQFVDILATPGQWFTAAAGSKLRQPSHPLQGQLLAPGVPPFLPGLSMVSSPSDIRALAWFADKYGCSGLFLPEVLNWDGDVFNSPAGSETRLFYPGRQFGLEQVLPSARLKRLRRGLQDMSYLWILRQRQHGAIADDVSASLVRYGGIQASGDNYLDARLDGWVQDAATWEIARRLLAEEIQAAIHPHYSTSSTLLAQRVAWREFEERTRQVRVEQERASVRRDEGRGEFVASVTLDLYNELPQDATVEATLEELPSGWRMDAPVKLPKLAKHSRATLTLTARGPDWPAAEGGKLPLRVAMNCAGRQSRLVVPAALLLSRTTPKAPRIDGSLDDWAVRAGNAAASFRVLGKRGRTGQGQANRATTAFVMHDQQNLYIAIRCEEPSLGDIFADSSNIVRYQQLMACGEDLVELILDPGCQAKTSDDLYHIVVKSNGIIVTEKGVGSDPPLGKPQAWPASVKAAVTKGDKAWIVELAIPLTSLGKAAQQPLWGVNFTRFATIDNEASGWSGFGRHFYDPRNLGSILLVP